MYDENGLDVVIDGHRFGASRLTETRDAGQRRWT